MQRVELVFVLRLSRQNPLRETNQFLQASLSATGHLAELPFDITHYASNARTQRAQRLSHAPVLLRVRVTADLAGQPRRLALVVLPQLQAIACGRFHQVFATSLEQT